MTMKVEWAFIVECSTQDVRTRVKYPHVTISSHTRNCLGNLRDSQVIGGKIAQKCRNKSPGECKRHGAWTPRQSESTECPPNYCLEPVLIYGRPHIRCRWFHRQKANRSVCVCIPCGEGRVRRRCVPSDSQRMRLKLLLRNVPQQNRLVLALNEKEGNELELDFRARC